MTQKAGIKIKSQTKREINPRKDEPSQNQERALEQEKMKKLLASGAAVRNVVGINNSVLRAKTKKVEIFDKRLWALLEDMKLTTLYSIGVGLAAPQIAISKKIVVVMVNDAEFEFINPEISNEEGESILMEGCLSLPSSMDCLVKRPQKLTLTYQDRHGVKHVDNFEGILARIICHEVDHLNGILFIDKKYTPTAEEITKVQ
ncbi:MAG: peptide deformylase [Christensenellaceae bacterium]|jgi:peptide deformylase|nr:peptide deformylase [Christensenellaceae bacterium]